MAIFNESAFGAGLTGSFGEVYIRTQNGKKVLCKKPTNRRRATDERSLRNKGNMKRLMDFSKVVTMEDFFHPLWKASDLRGVAGYHKCVGFNSPGKGLFNADDLKLLPFTPEIFVQPESASFNNTTFEISLNPPGDGCGINFQRQPFISAGAFVVLSNGTPEKTTETLTIPLKRKTLQAAQDETLNFKLESYLPDIDKYEDYTNKTVLVIFSSLNSEEQPVKHSKTFIYRF